MVPNFYSVCHSFRLVCLTGLCICTLASYGQITTSYERPKVQIPDPLCVINSTVIINGLIANFNPKDIESIELYKGKGEPPQLQSLGSAGIIDIKCSKRIKSESFAQVGRRLGLRGQLQFAINGYTISPAALTVLRIAPEAIGQIHITQPTPDSPAARVDIWLVLDKKPDTSKNPPGTIMIR